MKIICEVIIILKKVTTKKDHYCVSCKRERNLIKTGSRAWFYYRTKTTSRWIWFHEFCFEQLVEDITEVIDPIYEEMKQLTIKGKHYLKNKLKGS
ncbi:MAG: hypothetical protein HeimC3_26120 [Candidatus Heimdallarchaeota archaeon LC_3]|nr:MAG: hypothetical protein HeimC3_26120 [Candidatus Heimdallarchaeota archaeon LC_3]